MAFIHTDSFALYYYAVVVILGYP